MRIVHVFHQVNVDWATAGRSLTCPENLAWVAAVRVPNDQIGLAIRLTNHIDREWWLNDGVLGVVGSRSSSVGDVLIDPENGSLNMLTGYALEILPDAAPWWSGDPLYVQATDQIGRILEAGGEAPSMANTLAAALKDYTAASAENRFFYRDWLQTVLVAIERGITLDEAYMEVVRG